MALLERYYDVNSGQICVDNVNVKEMNIRNLRNSMGFVSQEPNLFNLSIKDNIAYGIDEADESLVIESAKLANMHDFIRTLPEVSLYHKILNSYLRVMKQ
jgi:ABC-type multidrug transport system fused ATPase/permease subunit